MIPDAVYRPDAAELRRYPAELRASVVTGSLAALNITGTIWAPSLMRHSLLYSFNVETKIRSDTNSSALIGLRISLVDIGGNTVGDLWSTRSYTAQPLIDPFSGRPAAANATFISSYTVNSGHSMMIPAGYGLTLTSRGWTGDALAPAAHEYKATLVTLGIPQGDIVR